MEVARYQLGRALRPFSLVVALVSCGLGVALALTRADGPLWAALLTLLAGLLLQSGVNLINDRSDLKLLPTGAAGGQDCRRLIIRNFRIGLLLFLLAALLCLPLLWRGGWPLLVLVLVGAAGALGYTLEPINYKARGLGVVLVFWLMGVLMVAGAYLAVAGVWHWPVLWLSLPVATVTSLLLLSNELRDWEVDRQQGVRTLVVRLGYANGRRLYQWLLLTSVMLPWLLASLGWISRVWLTLPVLLMVPRLLRLVDAEAAERIALTPSTGRFMAFFGGLYIGAALSF